MPEESFSLKKSAIDQLRRDHQQLKNIVRNLQGQSDGRLATSLPSAYYALTTSVITALVGDTLGSGTADVYRADANGVLVAVPSLSGQTIKNVAGEVASGVYVKVSPDQFGSWSVDVANCG